MSPRNRFGWPGPRRGMRISVKIWGASSRSSGRQWMAAAPASDRSDRFRGIPSYPHPWVCHRPRRSGARRWRARGGRGQRGVGVSERGVQRRGPARILLTPPCLELVHGSVHEPGSTRASGAYAHSRRTVHGGHSANHDDCETPPSLCTAANAARGEGSLTSGRRPAVDRAKAL